MISVPVLDEIYKISKQNNSNPRMIHEGVDYEKEFDNFESLEDALEFFRENENIFNIREEDIVAYYFYKHKSIEEQEEVQAEYNISIEEEIKKIKKEKELFKRLSESYEKKISELQNEYSNPEYEIAQMINKKQFEILDVTLADIVTVFSKLEPSEEIKIICYVNSEGKQYWKVNKQHQVKNFPTFEKFKENTIVLFLEVNSKRGVFHKKTILDFNEMIARIEVFERRQNDNTIFYVNQLCKDILRLEELKVSSVVSGKLELKISPVVDYNNLYKFFIFDRTAKYFFTLDESTKPWSCSKDFFNLNFFYPKAKVLHEFLGRKVYPNCNIRIYYKSKERNKYSITFKGNSEDVINEMVKVFVRLFSKFIKFRYTFTSTSFFSPKVHDELMERVGFLIKSLSSSTGKAFTSACPSDRQPINIKEEEIESYEEYGRNVEFIEFGGNKYWFTCMRDEYPYIVLNETQVTVKSGNAFFPCCNADKEKKKKEAKDKVKKDSSTLALTSAIKDYGNKSPIESGTLTEFLKLSFSTKGSTSVYLIGTSFPKTKTSTIKNSFIGCLIYACGEYDITNINSFENAVNDVRRRMIELPYDIYKQELFDVPFEKFVDDITNPNHYIDPYLYYRGLEEIFGVNIFVFTSARGREHSSSLEEYYKENPTLEIPRCHEYHTRIRLDRPIVCIYKNFGHKRTVWEEAACELIGMSIENSKDEIVTCVNTNNKRYHDEIWKYFTKCCNLLSFHNSEDGIKAFSDEFSFWDPNELPFGELKGQEVDVFGKTRLLIYDKYNVVVPGIQPLMLETRIPPKKLSLKKGAIKYTHNGYNFYILDNSQKERTELVSKKKIVSKFEVTDHDEEGCWVEFQGNRRGLKILCKKDKRFETINYRPITKTIQETNYVSGLLQLINWWWKSEESPDFESWFESKTNIKEVEYFNNVLPPTRCLNNLYLPRLLKKKDRTNFLEELWPYFFENKKINLYEELRFRINNMMKLQEFKTKLLDTFNEIPDFVTNLIPTEQDFEYKNSIVFTNQEDLKTWINYTSRNVYEQVSMSNMNIVNRKMYPELASIETPFIFKDSIGKIYIIQNVFLTKDIIKEKSYGSKKERSAAIEVAYIWSKQLKNLGPYQYNLNTTYPEDIPYVVFISLEDDGIGALEDYSNGTNEYLCIFKHANGNYAAMLPIL